MITNILTEGLDSFSSGTTGGFLVYLIRFALHFSVLLLIVRGLYYQQSKRRDYLFTFLLIGTMIYLLCSVLDSVRLELGMALGLFAIFGIIRYRTSQMPIKEMTYLFIVIGLAVINALASTQIGLPELVFTNLIVVLIAYTLEKLWTVQHVSRKVIQYDRIDLIKPENSAELQSDLEGRLGLDILRIDIGKVDFLRDSAKLVVYYNAKSKENNMADDIEQYYPSNND